MKVKMNEKRNAILAVLKNAEKPLTLAEISEQLNSEVKSGTTNAMLSAGLIRKTGTRKVAKTVYVEVAEYELGDAQPEEAKAE